MGFELRRRPEKGVVHKRNIVCVGEDLCYGCRLVAASRAHKRRGDVERRGRNGNGTYLHERNEVTRSELEYYLYVNQDNGFVISRSKKFVPMEKKERASAKKEPVTPFRQKLSLLLLLLELWVHIFLYRPVTVRPKETRMGSSKGSPEYWVSVVKPCQILYEMSGV
ncbi:hypothetical protein IEQ34_014573 [Dendrobium chrysotoxum]|uniref:50S ribosomal protein L16, chloroplastic n=1 Tax=Dendrobium chrysotoxum TaxID=161865 RepID=A0AAV7GKN7_DENCH|nr:hypothetical protein IEQ34_014573 [Dendrobium chrysotoxum]